MIATYAEPRLFFVCPLTSRDSVARVGVEDLSMRRMMSLALDIEKHGQSRCDPDWPVIDVADQLSYAEASATCSCDHTASGLAKWSYVAHAERSPVRSCRRAPQSSAQRAMHSISSRNSHGCTIMIHRVPEDRLGTPPRKLKYSISAQRQSSMNFPASVAVVPTKTTK